jgi:ribonuclease H2 subunit C
MSHASQSAQLTGNAENKMRVTVAKKTPEARLHLLPFAVVPQDDAPMQPARVSDYFLVREEGANLSASFRGRAVKGVRVTVPEGYTGAVLMVSDNGKAKKGAKRAKYSEDEDEDADGEPEKVEERKGTVTKVFRSMVVWQHDAPPQETDAAMQWMQWPQLAAAMHAPVEERLVNERKETEPAL